MLNDLLNYVSRIVTFRQLEVRRAILQDVQSASSLHLYFRPWARQVRYEVTGRSRRTENRQVQGVTGERNSRSSSFSRDCTRHWQTICTFTMAILTSPLQIISSTPIVTKSLTAATIGFSCLYLLIEWRSDAPFSTPYLTLIPGASLFYPWTFVTAGLVETTIAEVSPV